MNHTGRGMSRLDLLAIVVMFAIVGGGLVWGISKAGSDSLLRLGTVFLVATAVMVPIWIRGDRKEKHQLRHQLRELYLRGAVEKQQYIEEVGEAYYRRYHGDEDETASAPAAADPDSPEGAEPLS